MDPPTGGDTRAVKRTSLVHRYGWKRVAITLVSLLFVVPLTVAVFGVVFVPILAVPAVFGFVLLVAWYAVGHERHAPRRRTRAGSGSPSLRGRSRPS